jgi:molybdopterin converting factor small subunit
VVLARSLASLTAGQLEHRVEGRNVRQIIAALEQRFPGLGETITAGMAVAIDGEIHADPLLESVGPDSEVHFLPRVGGG